MKKKILFILALAVLFSACKMKLSENIGTVVIDFGSNERAVDTNGLPFIKDAAMSLEIISSNGSEKKDFAAGQEKTWSSSFPIGEKLTIKVSLSTASAEWKGYAEHTVTSGTNPVSVKLKKAAAALNSLLFGTNKPYTSSVNDYTFTLKIGSKEVKKERINYHNFCRDNKGRTYLVYNTGNRWNIERYTSEGGYDKTFSVPNNTSIGILASDHATGAVYALVSNSSAPYPNVCRIKEDGSFEEITLGESKYIGNIAVYNDILIAYINNRKLSSFKISGNKAEKLKDYALNDDQKIELQNQGTSTNEHGKIDDLYMTADTLYVLFSKYQTSWKYFSLGGIVKYSYNPADGTISKIKRIGIKDAHTHDENYIYPTDESNFYGPVKVIGFDEENLYIADDGIKFEFQKGKPRLTANKNRIATLKKEDDTLTFTDAPSGITWMGENPVWTGVSTKTIVWKKNAAAGFDYYQLDSAGDTPSYEKRLAVSESPNNYLTDVFCFDEAGNFYIVKVASSIFYVYRYVLEDDGSYEYSAMGVQVNTSNQPVAIAVDLSGSVKTADGNSANALYCSYDDYDKSCIKRLTWKGDAFSFAAADANFGDSGVFKGPTDTFHPTQTTRFTALAADKNGFFVAVKTLKNEETDSENYTIEVKKYAHNTTGSNSGSVSVTGETNTHWVSPSSVNVDANKYVHESLNALYILDGSLYGLTTKRIGVIIRFGGDNAYPNKSVITGKLLKIGDTAAFPINGDAVRLDNTPDLNSVDDTNATEVSGKFAPYRFIAVKPKKLVIASDGYYAPSNHEVQMVQKNKGYIYDLNSNTLDGGVDAHIEFSKKITSYFEW